ncbi:Zinc/iron permease [Macrophomina phaseolina MS6]|uniref:Zinc/iron permease n=1 Tax=Macrophomina phaseolina (strain MS6) TaxID=1126212 RepID=K2S253_MACPH|nr:Zinc/iron permease [Macrophomina phaseolina MS6]
MALHTRLLLLGYAALLAKGQTLMLSACTRIGNEQWCLDQNGSSVLWTSYASSTVASTTPAATVASTTAAPATTSSSSSITAVTDCHLHGTAQYCMAGTEEYQVMVTATATEELAAEYTGCHAHGSEMYCFDSAGEEYAVVPEGAEATQTGSDSHDHAAEDESAEASGSEGENCHFHAGVEHCVGAGESESGSSSSSCERRDRDYNVPLRIGLLFVVLATSALAVFAPILMGSYIQNKTVNFILMLFKQFGTGVMVSTAFIHLLTHANMMLTNECINYVAEYEGTAAAIMMAGIFIAFLIEYVGARILFWRNDRHAPAATTSPDGSTHHHGGGESIESGKAAPNNTLTTLAGCGNSLTNVHPGQEKLAVTVMETGIIFHSLRKHIKSHEIPRNQRKPLTPTLVPVIGLTLVVSGDSFFKTLFVVIVFHQAFEGIALGARIAELPSTATIDSSANVIGKPVTMLDKVVMASLFALVTPVGMAIGIGVLDQFNGNDPATLIAIGTLDAVSAGILAWRADGFAGRPEI